MSYDRPLQEIANGVIDSKGRFYSFTSAYTTSGNLLTAVPGLRYFIKEIITACENDGIASVASSYVSVIIEKQTQRLAYSVCPVTIAAVNGVTANTRSTPNILTDPGTAVNFIFAAISGSCSIIYAAVDENQDAKVTS